jgi:hypothetical protein
MSRTQSPARLLGRHRYQNVESHLRISSARPCLVESMEDYSQVCREAPQAQPQSRGPGHQYVPNSDPLSEQYLPESRQSPGLMLYLTSGKKTSQNSAHAPFTFTASPTGGPPRPKSFGDSSRSTRTQTDLPGCTFGNRQATTHASPRIPFRPTHLTGSRRTPLILTCESSFVDTCVDLFG